MIAIDVEAREARGLGVAADRIDLPAIAGIAQRDVRERRGGEKDDDRDRHRADLALAPPGERRLEAGDRSAGGEQKRRAAKGRHAAERHHERRNLEPGDRQPLEIAAGEPDRDRRERGQAPAVADAALADGEAVLEAAFGHRRGHQPGEGEQRADRKIDAGGQNHEGHADRQKAGDRNLPHHVEEIDRGQEPRLDDREQHHERDEEQRRREPGDEAEDVDAAEPGSVRLLSCRSSCAS